MSELTYKQSLNIQNFQLGLYPGAGRYDIPVILPEAIEITPDMLWYGFGEWKRDEKLQSFGCHFFLDDYRFQRVWNNPKRYLNSLVRFKCVLSPDFSLFTDYPKALQIYNHFRKHWVARYWWENGITVIPTIGWSDEESFEWCFDGEPEESIVAVSSIGVNNNKKAIEKFRIGYAEMERRLRPTQVLWFGKYCLEEPKENVIQCTTTHQKRLEWLRTNYNKG